MRRGGVVHAEGILGERIARCRKRAGTGAAADPVILAPAAPAAKGARIAQLLEKRGRAVDLDDVVTPHVAGGDLQKARRADRPGVRNEDDPIAVADAGSMSRGAPDSRLDFRGGAVGPTSPFHDDAA